MNKESDKPPEASVQVERGRHSTTGLSPERAETDESLRTEREKTDRAVAARQADMARRADAMLDHARNTADAVLSVARENADAVLDAARDKADERQAPASGNADQAALEKERSVADDALQSERNSADEILREEREEHAFTLRGFMPLERESTDRSLRSERIRADQAVVNRDDFLAIVAHDLRDMLSGIMLSSNVLAKRAEQNETGRSTLTETVRIGRYVARMGRLIGDLVDIASVEAGKLAVVPTPAIWGFCSSKRRTRSSRRLRPGGSRSRAGWTRGRCTRPSTTTASSRCWATWSQTRSSTRRAAARSGSSAGATTVACS